MRHTRSPRCPASAAPPSPTPLPAWHPAPAHASPLAPAPLCSSSPMPTRPPPQSDMGPVHQGTHVCHPGPVPNPGCVARGKCSRCQRTDKVREADEKRREEKTLTHSAVLVVLCSCLRDCIQAFSLSKGEGWERSRGEKARGRDRGRKGLKK